METLNVVKIGGHVVDEPTELRDFLADFAALAGPKILVHGGGKAASRMCQALGIMPVMVDGRRVTDAATLEVITGLYGGVLNKTIVTTLQNLGCQAIGLTGADGGAVRARKRVDASRDWGFVGDITSINVPMIHSLLNLRLVPVFAPLTLGAGTLLNTNADSLASALAVAFQERYDVKLCYGFEHAGVLLDVADANSCLPSLTRQQFETLQQDGTISSGMIPKLENGFQAVAAGVKAVGICRASAVTRFVHGQGAEGTWLH